MRKGILTIAFILMCIAATGCGRNNAPASDPDHAVSIPVATAPTPEPTTAPVPRVLTDIPLAIRPVDVPVAGHFPAGLYRWSIIPGLSDPTIPGHSFGYCLTYSWYPPVPFTFDTDTAYTLTITLRPATHVLPPSWADTPPQTGAIINANNTYDMWATVMGRDVPPHFYDAGFSAANMANLPTEGITNISYEFDGAYMLVHVTFEPTGAEVQPAQMIFHDDFSGDINQWGLTTDWVRAPNNLFRQDMSVWVDDMAWIEADDDGNHVLVLAYELAPPEDFDTHAPAWIWFDSDDARERARNNFIRGGAVRTHTTNWLEMTFDQSFGYWEARIQLVRRDTDSESDTYLEMIGGQAPGTWSAFWSMNRMMGFRPVGEGQQGTEIDVFESIGGFARGQYNAALHWPSTRDGGNTWDVRSWSYAVQQDVVVDRGIWQDVYNGEWFTVSVEWSPTNYRFFVNGVLFADFQAAQAAIGGPTDIGDNALRRHQVNQNPNYMKLSVESALWELVAAWGNTTDGRPHLLDGNFHPALYGEMRVDHVTVWNGPRPR
ncbi:MAG: family 16 glycosylhydrolase [Defluviitaleaceae bacterium]|nr:family 16 glycosylhydrolase [Defluviitaleaceae bacterium]